MLKAGSPIVTAALLGQAPTLAPVESSGPPSLRSQVSVPMADPQLQTAAKQLIEKHTIENVQLENALQEKETSEVQQLLSQFEDQKTKAIDDAMAELREKMSQVGVTAWNSRFTTAGLCIYVFSDSCSN